MCWSLRVGWAKPLGRVGHGFCIFRRTTGDPWHCPTFCQRASRSILPQTRSRRRDRYRYHIGNGWIGTDRHRSAWTIWRLGPGLCYDRYHHRGNCCCWFERLICATHGIVERQNPCGTCEAGAGDQVDRWFVCWEDTDRSGINRAEGWFRRGKADPSGSKGWWRLYFRWRENINFSFNPGRRRIAFRSYGDWRWAFKRHQRLLCALGRTWC